MAELKRRRTPWSHGRLGRRMSSENIYWTLAYKEAGSRQNGWEFLSERLKNVMKREGPRLFVFRTRGKARSAATPRVAFPAENKVLES